MPRPQIVVNVAAALPRRGDASPTGTAFLVFAGATGPLVPTRCLTAAQATAANVPAAIALWVGDLLDPGGQNGAQSGGAPEVIVLRAAAVDAAAVTEAEWKAALVKLTDEFGMGQVLIPGVATAAAYAALLDHANTSGRTVLLDAASNTTAATAVTAANGLAASPGSIRAGFIAPWVSVPIAGGNRTVPGSVFAAALASRGDALVGHANHAPMADQGRKAGYVAKGDGVTVVFSNADLDNLADAGVSTFVVRQGEVTLSDWKSVSDDLRFVQLNAGRISMEIGKTLGGIAYQHLGRQIDSRGHLFAELEGALRGYLQTLWAKSTVEAALYGDTPAQAFDVDTRSANTPATAAAGELRADVAVALTQHTDKVVINVVTATAEGI